MTTRSNPETPDEAKARDLATTAYHRALAACPGGALDGNQSVHEGSLEYTRRAYYGRAVGPWLQACDLLRCKWVEVPKTAKGLARQILAMASYHGGADAYTGLSEL